MGTLTENENIRLVVEALLDRGFTIKTSNEGSICLLGEILMGTQVTIELTIKEVTEDLHEINVWISDTMPFRGGISNFCHNFKKGDVDSFLSKMRINCDEAVTEYLRDLQKTINGRLINHLFVE